MVYGIKDQVMLTADTPWIWYEIKQMMGMINPKERTLKDNDRQSRNYQASRQWIQKRNIGYMDITDEREIKLE